MKLCIPTMDDRGMEAVTSDHFGSAPFFTLVDTETGECETIANRDSRAHGTCQPLEFLGPSSVDVMLCKGLGRRAFARLQSAGVDVYVTREGNVKSSVEAFQEDRLQAMNERQACGGRHGGHHGGHHGGSHHGHHGGC